MVKHLLLVWEDTRDDGAGSYHSLIFDLIHADLFLSPRSEGEHFTAYTDAGGRVDIRRAVFKSRSSGNIVTFDYNADENANNNIYPGTMILDFDSVTKSDVIQMHWHDNNHQTNLDVEHSPGGTIVNASWKEFDPESIKEDDEDNDDNHPVKIFIEGIISSMGWNQSLYSEE